MGEWNAARLRTVGFVMSSVPAGPNAIRAAWSILRARRVRRPIPLGNGGGPDHSALHPVLAGVQEHGVPALTGLETQLGAYLGDLVTVDPDALARDHALAYWLNLYNAGALDVAARTAASGRSSVLRLPGAFDAPIVEVAGEHLSLDDIEHGKIRRFGDPRVHGALVCGSASCPTLRAEPYSGNGLASQLDDQMRSFLAAGGADADPDHEVLELSRVMLWYGGDFTRPHRMPTVLPARRSRIATALLPWMAADVATWVAESRPTVRFKAYDWSLACAVGR